MLPARALSRLVFSASAFHWVDPEVSWRKAADVLIPGGTLALVQYFGLQEPRSEQDQEAALAAIRKVAPDAAASWPRLPGPRRHAAPASSSAAATSPRYGPGSASTGIGQDDAGPLFGDVQAAVMPRLVEHTPDELNDPACARCRSTPGFHRTSVRP